MLRSIPLALLLHASACEPPLPPRALPQLVAADGNRGADPSGYWRAGERMVWQVRWRGMAIGHADLVVGREPIATRKIVSRFVPAAFARSVQAPIVHEGTALSHGKFHSLQSVMGWLRSWSVHGRGRAQLLLRHGGHQYKVNVAEPVAEPGPDALVRIRARATRAYGAEREEIDVHVWITVDASRSLRRIVVERDGQRILATLASHEL